MGRKRTIDREAVLDAAQYVVQRDGVARLTLDAVTAEAGISKASVLYDYKTKPALVRAMVERKIAAEDDRIDRLRAEIGDTPNAAVRTRIAACSDPATEDDQAFTLCLAAAMAQDSDLRQPICSRVGGVISEIKTSSDTPNGALLAFLALEGLKLMEYFGVYRFDPEDRHLLLEEIGWLAEQVPGAVPVEDLAKTG